SLGCVVRLSVLRESIERVRVVFRRGVATTLPGKGRGGPVRCTRSVPSKSHPPCKKARRVAAAWGTSAPCERRRRRRGIRIEEKHEMRSKKTGAFAGVFGLAGSVLAVLSMAQVASDTSSTFGDPLPGLTADEQARFDAGKAAFEEEEDVGDGLGPVFNENSCVACHSTVVGGSSVTGAGSTRLETRFG